MLPKSDISMQPQDVNFDDLAAHFSQRIYGSSKGKIRLAVLQRDLLAHIPNVEQGGLRILDIGGGMGQMGLHLARFGHQLTINDISGAMLALAKDEARKQDLFNHIEWIHGPFQNLEPKAYDVVICHAVLEWLVEPEALLEKISTFCGAKTIISLMFYNADALILHNLIRGNFNKIKKQNFSGMKGGLTPLHPIQPAWVEAQLAALGFRLIHKSGVRVFSDYVGIKRGGNEDDVEVLNMELLYSTQQPFIDIARYVHFVYQAKAL